MRLVGPVLYFRGQADDDRWRLSALVVHPEGEEAPPLEPEGEAPARTALLASRRGRGLWRHDFAFQLGNEAGREARYAIGGETWAVHLPPAGGRRRLAYTACNGVEDEGEGNYPDDPGRETRYALWRGLAAEHARDPFHLLLQGGDQLYADSLWDKVPSLAAWRRLSWKESNRAPFTAEMADGADRYYLERYFWLWSQPELAPLLASVPSVMMWDDHDIFDGWGSWPADRQGCPVFRGVYAIAREHFVLFQLAVARPGALPEGFADQRGVHFGCAFRVGGGLGIVAPDLRSERTRERIMGEAGWRDFEAMIGSMEGCRHLLVMSSVPLANTDLSPVERLLVAIPGHNNLEDDLRDQWQSYAHRAEWRRMLEALVAFSARTGTRVTSLSGEIHLGALGLVEGDRGVRIHGLVSSGIVSPPPPAALVAVYELLGRRSLRPGPGLLVRLLAIPGHGRRYLRERNWLSLTAVGDGRFEAVWHAERGEAGRLAVAGAGNGAF